MKFFKAIAAMSENRVIGRNNQIPWRLPEDFKWFKQTTTGQIVVMGRKTFDSIGRPLPNRTTIVLSRSGTPIPGVRVLRDLAELDLLAESQEIFICGGAQIYEQTLARCSDLFLTVVKQTVDGDTFFPVFEDRFRFFETIRETDVFAIRHYRNPSLE